MAAQCRRARDRKPNDARADDQDLHCGCAYCVISEGANLASTIESARGYGLPGSSFAPE
jgi:hypothetical protein